MVGGGGFEESRIRGFEDEEGNVETDGRPSLRTHYSLAIAHCAAGICRLPIEIAQAAWKGGDAGGQPEGPTDREPVRERPR
jgi:hypothetical protein